jgi:hypothetical protein
MLEHAQIHITLLQGTHGHTLHNDSVLTKCEFRCNSQSSTIGSSLKETGALVLALLVGWTELKNLEQNVRGGRKIQHGRTKPWYQSTQKSRTICGMRSWICSAMILEIARVTLASGDSSCWKWQGGKIHMISETVSRYLTKQLNSSYPANARNARWFNWQYKRVWSIEKYEHINVGA